MSDNNIIPIENIQDRIFTIRGVQIMIDEHLAEIYGVSVKRLNEQVKRNIERFPEKFRFQLTSDEYNNLRSQIATIENNNAVLRSQIATLENEKRGKHRKYLPYVFTEQGVSMLSAVLKSETAVKVSVKIIDAFVETRKFLYQNAEIFLKINEIENKQRNFQIEADEKFNKLFDALENNSLTQNQAIFFDGQFYDAYIFIADLIRIAKKDIVLIDNYIDDTVLTLFTKRNSNVKLTIYTQKITEQLKLDIDKHNSQYPVVEVKKLKKSHDRFLIIDEKDLYHIGASLKDLGKRWFAVSKFEYGVKELLERL